MMLAGYDRKDTGAEAGMLSPVVTGSLILAEAANSLGAHSNLRNSLAIADLVPPEATLNLEEGTSYSSDEDQDHLT